MLQAQWIHGTEDLSPARAVRTAVFVDEQGYSPEDEFDNYDSMAWHVVALDDEVPIAAGRVYLAEGDYHIGRICVLPEYRNFGVGDAIIRLLIDRCMMAGCERICLSSQLYIKEVYKKFGFEEVGEPYTLPGDTREHIDMIALRENVVLPHNCGGCSGDCGGGCEGCSSCGEEDSAE